jgi:hypothetical protein
LLEGLLRTSRHSNFSGLPKALPFWLQSPAEARLSVFGPSQIAQPLPSLHPQPPLQTTSPTSIVRSRAVDRQTRAKDDTKGGLVLLKARFMKLLPSWGGMLDLIENGGRPPIQTSMYHYHHLLLQQSLSPLRRHYSSPAIETFNLSSTSSRSDLFFLPRTFLYNVQDRKAAKAVKAMERIVQLLMSSRWGIFNLYVSRDGSVSPAHLRPSN